jgi:hypothetical protein
MKMTARSRQEIHSAHTLSKISSRSQQMFKQGDRVLISIFGKLKLAKIVGRSELVPGNWVLFYHAQGIPVRDSFPERAITSVGDRVKELHLVSEQDGFLGLTNTILGGK